MKTFIVVVTKKGKALKFNAKELAKTHPEGEGKQVVELGAGDQVVSAFSVQHDE